MEITVPEQALVILMGVNGSGKTSFCYSHFHANEILSMEYFTALMTNDTTTLASSKDALDVVLLIAKKRLEKGLLTVIDAPNLRPHIRQSMRRLAKECHVPLVLIIMNTPKEDCIERQKRRPNISFSAEKMERQHEQFERTLRHIRNEGIKNIHHINPTDTIEVTRRILSVNEKKNETGPFDIIGDVHGCIDELLSLLKLLDYKVKMLPKTENYGYEVTAPEGRKVVFVGDYVDRGPDSVAVLRLVMSMSKNDTAICLPGNHDYKLSRHLRGLKKVKLTHGLDKTAADLDKETPEFREEVRRFIKSLAHHYVLDNGKLVVAHAGIREEYHGKESGKVMSLCLYGETSGKSDEYGFPIRYNWGKEYTGEAMVVFGHTPVPEAAWQNNTIDIDTACCFGGKLTALRYPERTFVSVPALRTYAPRVKPLEPLS